MGLRLNQLQQPVGSAVVVFIGEFVQEELKLLEGAPEEVAGLGTSLCHQGGNNLPHLWLEACTRDGQTPQKK